MEHSAITCDKFKESYNKETAPTNFSEKRATCSMQNFYILLEVSLITISLSTAI